MKYTKGEWVYVGGDNGSCEINIGETTATVDRSDKNTGAYVIEREEMEANAKLIAAAPDLLEALTVLLEIVEKVHGNAIIGKPARMKAKQAILKATA